MPKPKFKFLLTLVVILSGGTCSASCPDFFIPLTEVFPEPMSPEYVQGVNHSVTLLDWLKIHGQSRDQVQYLAGQTGTGGRIYKWTAPFDRTLIIKDYHDPEVSAADDRRFSILKKVLNPRDPIQTVHELAPGWKTLRFHRLVDGLTLEQTYRNLTSTELKKDFQKAYYGKISIVALRFKEAGYKVRRGKDHQHFSLEVSRDQEEIFFLFHEDNVMIDRDSGNWIIVDPW